MIGNIKMREKEEEEEGEGIYVYKFWYVDCGEHFGRVPKNVLNIQILELSLSPKAWNVEH